MSALDRILAYDFDNDGEFTAGVQAILSNQPQISAEERDMLINKAKLYYFNRKTGLNINLDEYIQGIQAGHEQQRPVGENAEDALSAPSASTALATAEENERSEIGGASENTGGILTFAEVKYLIETGQTHLIPNNKVIPDELNEAPPSVSVAQAKRKPWENVETTSSNPLPDS